MAFKTKRRARGFRALTALGETMFIREGDLVAVRKGRFRARPARVVREVTTLSPRFGHRFVGVLYDEHKAPHAKATTIKCGDVLGYWQ
ncbi:MAG: hypothetical protein E6R03_06365 [Hyphomicrobiaceae bacterium]|nr:MAG: hypothetical protein E6R03_06365 [Hyphomicrobiaceae bacterium]